MKIIEEITGTWYLGEIKTGVYEGTRMLIQTDESLKVGDSISKESPIKLDYINCICELCKEIYGSGEDYNERMKQQAIDVKCGFLQMTEIENILN